MGGRIYGTAGNSYLALSICAVLSKVANGELCGNPLTTISNENAIIIISGLIARLYEN